MQKKIKKLILDQEDDGEEDVVIIALYSAIEMYRLAYFVNKFLEINLRLNEEKKELYYRDEPAAFSLYSFYDESKFINFYLVSNKVKLETVAFAGTNSLFSENEEGYTYLIPEYRQVDYFLKLEDTSEVSCWVDKLRKIKYISAIHPIKISELKNYKNLIFE